MPKLIDPADAVAVMRAAGVTPLEEYPGYVSDPWRVRCDTCGEVGTPRYRDVRSGMSGGCWSCGMRKRAASKRANNAKTAYDEMRAAGAEPLDDYPGANERWPSRCLACDETITPTLSGVRRGAGVCRYCARVSVADTLRLGHDEAAAVMRAAGVEPIEQYKGASEPWRCRCTRCGHEGTPSYNAVQRGQGGCVPCGNARGAAAQRVDEAEAVAEMRAAGLEPLEPYTNSHAPWLSRCLSCEREVTPALGGVRSGQGGCIYCADRSESGYRPGKPGAVYVVESENLDAVKVGVTGAASIKRLIDHERHGWQLVDVWHYDDGADALAVERAVLDEWRGLPRGATRDQMPQGGHTETVRRVDVSAADAVTLVRSVAPGLTAAV